MSIKRMKTLTVGETTYQVVDSTVPDWARESTKPTDFANGGTMGGSLIINGDLTVNGISTTVETFNENINVEDNTITLRHNATTGLQNGDYTGIVAQKYDGTNNGMLVFDNTGTAYVGDEGDVQPLATRKLAAEDNGELVSWDAAKQTLVKAPVKVENIVTKDNFDSLNTVLSTNTNNAEMSYVKDVPADSANYAAVQKVGGMTRKCANLWDEQWEVGQILIDTGTTTAGETRIRSKNFIPLDSETEYHFSHDNNSNVFFCYDKNYGFLGVKYQWDKKFTTLPNTKYVKFMLTPDYGTIYNNNIMLNEGATALPYEPYFEGLRSAKVTEVKSVGVNLFDYESHKKNDHTSIIKVKPNKTLYRNGQLGNIESWGIYDNADALIGTFATFNFIASNPMVLPYNAAYIKVHDPIATLETFYLGYDSDTTYRPYVKHTLPIPEAVRPANGINENVYDYIEWAEDGSVKQGVRCGVVDLGTLDWTIAAGATNIFYADIDNSLTPKSKGYSGVCSMYDVALNTNAVIMLDKTMFIASSAQSSQAGRAFVKDTNYTDAASFKAAMSGVMLVYELAEPIVTDISDLITTDNMLGVEGNGTLTFENEYRYDVPSEVVFYNEKAEIVAADEFVGDLTGTAKRAVADKEGRNIEQTYATKAEVNEKLDVSAKKIYSDIKYQEDVPADSANYAVVNKIGGMTRKCANLFGGDVFADKFVAIGGAKNATKGTVSIPAYTVNGKQVYSGFKANTQYTFIFKASVTTPGGINIAIRYTDNTSDIIDIWNENTITTVTMVSKKDKTIQALVGEWQADTTYYYNECGIFEGVIEQSDFEPYFEGLRSAKVTEVKSVGVNLAQPFKIDTNNIFVQKTPLFEVKPNTDYYVSAKYNSILGTRGANFFVVKTDGSPLYTKAFANDIAVCINSGDNTKLYLQVNNGDEAIVSDESLNWLNTSTIVNKGSTAQPYTPYVEHTFPIPIEVRGSKNLIPFPYDFGDATRIDGITFDTNSDGFITVNGTAERGIFMKIADINTLNGDYFISGCPAGGSDNTYKIIVDENNVGTATDYGSGEKFSASNGNTYSVIIYIPQGSVVSNLVFKPMLNEGTTPLPYEPCGIAGLDGYGLGISDTVYNYIDYEKKQFVKRVGVVDMGTLGWYMGSVFYANVVGRKPSQNNLLCSQYANAGTIHQEAPNATITGNTADGYIYVKDFAYTDSATFKAAMSGVMLVYELAEPIVTDISDLITADNMLSVEGGGTLTFKNAYEYAVPSEVVFYEGTNDVVGANTFVGDLLGTAARADKATTADKALVADRVTTIDLSQYNGTDNIPVEFARAIGDDKCYALIVVQSGSLYPACVYYITNDDHPTQIAGRVNNSLITYQEDYLAPEKTYGFYCGKLGHNFPQITVLAFNGNINFFVGEKRTSETFVENSKYLYFGKPYIDDENANTLDIFSRGANGLTFGQAETLKTFAVGETITISGTTNTVRIETDGFDLSDGVYAVTFELTSTGPDYHYRFTGMIDWVKSAALSSFISIIDNLRIQVSYVQFLSKTVLVVEMIDKLIPNIGRVTANYTFTLRRIY